MESDKVLATTAPGQSSAIGLRNSRRDFIRFTTITIISNNERVAEGSFRNPSKLGFPFLGDLRDENAGIRFSLEGTKSRCRKQLLSLSWLTDGRLTCVGDGQKFMGLLPMIWERSGITSYALTFAIRSSNFKRYSTANP